MDAATGFPSPNHNVNVKVLHGAIQHFLYRHRQTVNLIDKEDIARLQIIKNGHQITSLFNDRTRSLLNIHTEFVGDDKGHSRLSQTWRTKKQSMVQRLIPQFSCFNKNLQLIFDLILTNIFS